MSKTEQTRSVSAEKLDRLSAWARRKPRIGLMGEFSSGKSTLLNLLIGEDLLPTKVTATELPPVWFSHGRPRAFWVDRHGRRHPLGFGEFGGVPMSARCVRVFTPSPILERCDIIDTPGISDPNLEEDSWRFAVGQSNFILWCTPATQAWRETERSTWISLPERLRTNSVLVVTRADKLVNDTDREKVTRRLSRETFGLFGGLVLLSSLDAVRGKAELARTGGADTWARSGGAELDTRIEAGLRSVSAERLDLLERYVSTGPARPRPTPVAAPPEEPPMIAAPASRVLGTAETIQPRRVERNRTQAPDRRFLFQQEPPSATSLAEADRTRLDDGRPLLLDPRWTESVHDASALSEASQPIVIALGEEYAAVAGLGLDVAAGRAVNPVQPDLVAEDDSIRAVLAAMAAPREESEPDQPAREAPLPRAVRIWRNIIRQNPEMPSNDPVLAMIDQLLHELSHDDQLLGENGLGLKDTVEKNRAA
ncbi:hypothetical protein FHG66_12505 [Rubellimicrobium rubrum]|uniref:Dynamin N-terminal domain-containing protein n=1 Tax=Rubellimicrobium rubrum TaxID=2585369 RepID=A0A5C4MX56_9RHOB|nr:dynamin family protein [Rubellimicrobium rubrum]TNC48982.1 hypothetical protein FHG66_12505 [Rubellimicrobium rubrum]